MRDLGCIPQGISIVVVIVWGSGDVNPRSSCRLSNFELSSYTTSVFCRKLQDDGLMLINDQGKTELPSGLGSSDNAAVISGLGFVFL